MHNDPVTTHGKSCLIMHFEKKALQKSSYNFYNCCIQSLFSKFYRWEHPSSGNFISDFVKNALNQQRNTLV